MRHLILLTLLSLVACHASTTKLNPSAMTSEQKAVRAALNEFLAAGDAQNVARLETVLDPTYRIVINQFMGGEGVSVISRETYLQMIGDGKLGGTPRTVDIKSVEVVGNLAHVRALLSSSELNFNAHYTLAKDKAAKWKLVADAPFVSAK